MDNRQTERTPQKCFIFGSQDHLIIKFLKPPKENEKRQKQVRFNEKGDRACNNSKNNNDQEIYAYMSRMSGYDKCPSANFGDSLQLTNWFLDSVAMCHMKPKVSDFITG